MTQGKKKYIILGIFDKRQHNRQYMRTIWRYLPGKSLKDWSPDMVVYFKHPFLVQHFMRMTQEIQEYIQEIQEYIQKMKPKMYTSKAADIAAESGNLAVLQELRKVGISCTSAGVYNAANNGHLCILKDIYEHEVISEKSNIPYLLSSCCLVAVAAYGHLNVLQFLLEDLGMEYNEDVMYYASQEGYLHIVKYLHEHGYPILYPDAIVNTAIQNGHLQIVEYFHDKCAYKFDTTHINFATENGHNHIVEYLQNKC